MDLLSKCSAFEWHITPIVRGEIRSARTLDALNHAIIEGKVKTVEFDSDDDAVHVFAKWRDWVDPGEAEAIAVSISRDWMVALEDRKAQRLMDREVGPGRWTNLLGILVSAVRSDELSVGEADGIFESLDVFAGYKKKR